MKRWYSRLRQDLHVFRALFPWRVGLALLLGTAVMAFIFQRAYLRAYGTGDFSYLKAVYAVFNMAALQVSFADMPPGPALDVFFIIVPLISIPLLLIFGANLLHVLRVFFVRRERGQMWQRALAGTVNRPVVVLGLGHIGYRVVSELLDMKQPVIGLDNTDSPLIQALIDRDVPVILGDARDRETLVLAGVDRASVVVVCTYDDLANIEAAFHVRKLNETARIVLRLFEDTLFGNVSSRFHIEVTLSRSAIAAQAFAYAALGVEALETFNLNGETYVLAEMPIKASSTLAGQSLRQIAIAKKMTIVCLYRQGKLRVDPDLETQLTGGDSLFLFTHLAELSGLAAGSDVEPSSDGSQAVLVCGLGHTGYRVVETLHDLGRSVVGLDFEPSHLADQLQELNIPVIYGDFRRHSVLEKAGMAHAQALIACTEDDMVNFETGMRARDIRPEARIVIRIFEEPLGEQIEQAFGIDAVYSTSAIAAPAFVAAALDIQVTQRVALGETLYHMARIKVETPSGSLREPLGALTDRQGITVLLHKRESRIQIPPDPAQSLRPGDEIVVLATRDKLRELSFRGRSPQSAR